MVPSRSSCRRTNATALGSRFAHPKAAGEHKVHDTQVKWLRHLNFFQHECCLEVRVPRVKLPDGKVALDEPDWVGKLAGFTFLFEALVLVLPANALCRVARTIGESWHRVHAICCRYVDLALAGTDLSVTIDGTSYRRGHSYLTLVADADVRKVVFVSKGRGADNIAGLCPVFAHPQRRGGQHHRGLHRHVARLHQAAITSDNLHAIAHASQGVDKMRRVAQRTDPALKVCAGPAQGQKQTLPDRAGDLNRLVIHFTTNGTTRA